MSKTPETSPSTPTDKDTAKAVVAPVPATLAEQKSDFTAEGSPPPGKVVSTVAPVKPKRGNRSP